MPFLVIHGEDDPLVTVSGGRATAAAVPGPSCSRSRAWATICPRRCGATVTDAIVANTELAVGLSVGQASSALAAATEASQAALGLGVRAKVSRSTLTMPKRGR